MILTPAKSHCGLYGLQWCAGQVCCSYQRCSCLLAGFNAPFLACMDLSQQIEALWYVKDTSA